MNFESPLYPAIYRAPLKDRIVPVLIIASLYIGALFGRVHLESNSSIWAWSFAVAGLVFLIVAALSITSSKITLYPDRIERKGWLDKKVMRRNDISCVRKHKHNLVMIVYKYNSGDGMIIPKGIGGDAARNAWMADVKGNEIFKRLPYDV